MNIGTLQTNSHLPGTEPDIWQLLREKNAQTPATAVEDTASSPQNMMQGNFVQAQSEDSRYVAAMKNSLTVSMQLQDSMRSSMTSLVGGLGKTNEDGTLSAGTGAAAAAPQAGLTSVTHTFLRNAGIDPDSVGSGAGASMAMQRMSAKQVIEASEETLDTMTDDIEQKAEETTTPEETTNEDSATMAPDGENTEAASPPSSPTATPPTAATVPSTENSVAPSTESGEQQETQSPTAATPATDGAGTSGNQKSVDVFV